MQTGFDKSEWIMLMMDSCAVKSRYGIILPMCMLDTIHAKRDDIHAAAKRHKAEKLWVFGSVARKEDTADSDVDFLVKFAPGASWRDDEAFREECRILLGRDVDVVRNTAVLRDPYFAAQVCPEAVRI